MGGIAVELIQNKRLSLGIRKVSAGGIYCRITPRKNWCKDMISAYRQTCDLAQKGPTE